MHSFKTARDNMPIEKAFGFLHTSSTMVLANDTVLLSE